MSTLVDNTGKILPLDITERLSSNALVENVAKADNMQAVRDLVTEAVGDFESADISRATIIETITLEIERTKRRVAGDSDLEIGRRQGERRNIVKNSERREISIVKNELLEALGIEGVPVRGDFFQKVGSDDFIISLLANMGDPLRQVDIIGNALRDHFPESQLTDFEVMATANKVVRELNLTIQNRRIGDLTEMLGLVQRGELPPSAPADAFGSALVGQREGVERRERGGRREGEGLERRRGEDLTQRAEGIGLINDMVLLALRRAEGDVHMARINIQILLQGAAEIGAPAGTVSLLNQAMALFERSVQGLDQLNTFQGFTTKTRRTPAEIEARDVAAFEATRLSPRDLEAMAAGREISRVQTVSEVVGDDAIAAEWISMKETSANGTLIDGIGADRRLVEIEAQFTPEQLQALDALRLDEFGLGNVLPSDLRDLAIIKRHWDPRGLVEFPTGQLLSDLLVEIEAPETRGLDAAAVFIKMNGIFRALQDRGLSTAEIGNQVADLFVTDRGLTPEDATTISRDGMERLQRASQRLDNVPQQVAFPGEPLVPSDIAENLAHWLRNEGDPIGALLDQVRTKKNQTVIVRGEETPGNTLAQAVSKLDPDFDVIIHKRPDGLFDIAIAGPGSPLQLEVGGKKPLRTQFEAQGRFIGQKISVNGQKSEFVMLTKDNIVIRDRRYITAANPKGVIEIARSLVSDVRDVESINEFDKVASSQRGLPERAMLRIKDAQISQVYQWLAEHIGDLTRMMSEGITFNKGNFGDVLLSVDRLIKEMEPIDALTLRVMREVAENSLVKANPIVPVNVLTEVRAGVTADPNSLTVAERRDLTRLEVLARDYAGFHAEIPTINRVQKLAQNAATALGEFKFEEALESLKALQGELGKGRANWEKVTANSTTPSIREILEEHLDPEELETWDRLVKRLQPPTTQQLLESGEEFSFDRMRALANVIGMKLEINPSGTFVLRGQDRGFELFASPDMKAIADFIRNSGQAQGLDMDQAHDVDPDVPGSVQPPPADPPRMNEPMPFPEGRLIEMLLEGATAISPFLAPFKDFSAGYDAINKTEIHKMVWLNTNAKAFESTALGAQWANFEKKTRETDPGLKDVEATLKKFGFRTKERRELVSRWFNSMSKAEVVDLLNIEERAIVDLLDTQIPNGATAKRAFQYIDDVRTEMRETARRLGFEDDITKLSDILQKQIAARVQVDKNYTDVDAGIAKFFIEIAKRPMNKMNLPLIVRAFEAGRTGALNRADFAKQERFNIRERAALQEYDDYWVRISNKPGVRIKDLAKLRSYQANYAWRQTAAPEDAYLGQKGIDEELKFVNSMVRMGETGAYSLDPIEVAARFTRGAANQATGFDKAWDVSNKFVATLPKGLGRMVAESYLGAVRGNLPAITREVENVMNTIFKEMGWKVPSITIRNMVNSVLALMSTAAISLRPGLTIRDLTTGVVMHYARFGGSPIKGQGRIRKGFESVGVGPTRTIRMLNLGFTEFWETGRALRDQGVVPSIGPIQFETPSELLSSNLGKGIAALPKFMQDVANWGFVMGGQKTMYEILFSGTLLESREFVGAASTMFQKGEITKPEFYNIIKLDAFQRVVQKEFDELVTAENFDQAVELLSRQSAIDILGLYGMGNHPWGWGTNTGKMFGQFGIWPVSAAQFVLGGLTRGKKNSIPILNHFVSGRQIGFASRLAMTQAAFFVGGQAIGLDFYRWLLFPGIFFTGGPTVQMAQDVAQILNGSDDDRRRAIASLRGMFPEIDLDDMRNTDIRSMFFPFSYFIGDIQQGIEARERGEPLPGVLGRFFSVPLSDKPSWLETGSPFFFQEEEE